MCLKAATRIVSATGPLVVATRCNDLNLANSADESTESDSGHIIPTQEAS
jgi:hypothetical protein